MKTYVIGNNVFKNHIIEVVHLWIFTYLESMEQLYEEFSLEDIRSTELVQKMGAMNNADSIREILWYFLDNNFHL